MSQPNEAKSSGTDDAYLEWLEARDEALAQRRPLIDVGTPDEMPKSVDETLDLLRRLDGLRARAETSLVRAPGFDPGGAGEGPAQIGRFTVLRQLGRGGFGRVYLAFDADLQRHVAIKLPIARQAAGRMDVAAYLHEARILAQLDHPNIVPVYEVGRTDGGLYYIVSKYIEGSDLEQRLRAARPSVREAVELVAIVAEALHHAHARDLVHRDIKPANLLIDLQGRPCVADFGLALRDADYGKGARIAGTPAYMSPEQARGEGHRVDGRSDIFSLGTVFYELLTGRKPFRGDSRTAIMDQIATVDPRPPRQIDDTIPRELERICQKALARRLSQRYSTARDLADDLREFLRNEVALGAPPPTAGTPGSRAGGSPQATPGAPTPARPDSDGPPLKVVPKGLRSFDRHDADFFLELLPGPRDRDGLPESLRFWKTRIESTDLDTTFKVGLIYGPSGCGKSSLVKAGLLPRLPPSIRVHFIEATPDETETRLQKALHMADPDPPEGPGLVDTLAELRRGRVLQSGHKVLLVLDQFEQWLSARPGEAGEELVAALRQCDGPNVQAIVLVRDDFWMATTRFMRDLEIDLVPDRNLAVVDLFDPRHARKVLTAFGRAHGTLPQRSTDHSRDQESFLDRAISGLAQDGKVIPVRLALFAEMVKGKPWIPATLREVGGIEGIGTRFLEETFSSPANPKHRVHHKAAQAILKALLPQAGTDIKGQMQPESTLRDASGYAARPQEFHDLISLLDHDLRLITPIDLEGTAGEWTSSGQEIPRCFQLSHDYLVPSLRDWLTRKQRETRRGRATLRLDDRTELWNAQPENRRLPSVLEWVHIRLWTRTKDWTDRQRKMMKRAGRVHGLRALGAAALIALLTWGGIEGYGDLRASALVASLKSASTTDVLSIIQQVSGFRRWANPRLLRLLGESEPNSREHLHASLALLPVDPSQVDPLSSRMLTIDPIDLPVVREALRPHESRLISRLWSALEGARPGDPSLLPAAGALALYDPESRRWESAGDRVSQALVTVNSIYLRPWLESLQPVRKKLNDPLAAIFRDRNHSESEHTQATNILTDFAGDDPNRVADLLMDADPKAYAAFFPIVRRQAAMTLPRFQEELARKSPIPWNDPALGSSWVEPADAIVTTIERARGLLTARFAFCQTMPLNEFLATAEGLNHSGFRPIRFRPSAEGPIVRVAAVWTRDGRKWRVAFDAAPDAIQMQDAREREDNLLPIDAAGYVVPTEDGEPTPRYAALWGERGSFQDDARMIVGVTADELRISQGQFEQVGMSPRALVAGRGPMEPLRYCGIWQKTETTGPSASRTDLVEGSLPDALAQHLENTLIDLSVMPSGEPGDRGYAVVWSGYAGGEAIPSYGLDPTTHLHRCRELAAQGYRIASLSVARTTPEGAPATASVWHRPEIAEDVKDRLAQRQARAAVTLVRLGQIQDVLPLLRHSADPLLRSFIVNWLHPLGADPRSVAATLEGIPATPRPAPRNGERFRDAVLFHPETSLRRALIMALGTYGTDALAPGEREPLIRRLLDLYRHDPDSGIHGAAEWTLRQWRQESTIRTVVAEPSRVEDRSERSWYVNGQGQTFAVIDGPVEFRIGSPPSEAERTGDNERYRAMLIPRRFAIATKEVTVEQFQRFVKTHPEFGADPSWVRRFSPDPEGPCVGPSWYAAAAYCNWLSQQEGIPKEQWCYVPNESGAYAEGMTIPAHILERTGYRLPTEAEWEYSCRAGTVTSRYHGGSIELLAAYARYQANSTGHAWKCGSLLPNDLGCFDMLGNVYEWCQDGTDAPRPRQNGVYRDIITTLEDIRDKTPRILRGGTRGSPPFGVRSAMGYGESPSSGDLPHVGFRPARTAD